ncbi:MAG: ATP-binding protein [Nitrospirota bacterium]
MTEPSRREAAAGRRRSARPLIGYRGAIVAAMLTAGVAPLTAATVTLWASRHGLAQWPAWTGPTLYAVSVGLAVAIAIGGSRVLSRPIRALRDGVRRIGEGDLDHRLNVPAELDLAQLAAAFNLMAARLAESHRTLEQTVADRTMALTAVNTVAVTVNRSLDPDEILGSVLDRLPLALNVEAAFIRLLDARGLTLRAHRGVPTGALEALAVCPQGEGLSGRVAARGAPLTADAAIGGLGDAGEAVLFAQGFRAAACVPVMAKGHLVGTLAVASRDPRTFTPQDLNLLTSIGSQVGTALENAGLYERACALVKEFEQLDRLKTEFLSNVGHELRIPLTAIIGFSELLLGRIPGPLTPEQERYVRIMLDSGRDLLGMINNVLDLSKIKAGKLEWHASAFDLRPLAGRVGDTLGPLIDKQHLRLVTELDDAPVIAFADEGLVKQVLLNLVSNAVKFTPPGGVVTVRIQGVDHGVDSDAVEIRVEDTGIGIAPEDLDRIFQEFHQVDGSPTRDHPGTGLGLAIAKRLVELQGGRIWAESRAGFGSRFTVLLPRGRTVESASVRPRPAGIMEAVMESLVATAAARSLVARNVPKIAVVGSARTLKQVRKSMDGEGYEAQAVAPDDVATVSARPTRPFAVMVEVGDHPASRAAMSALRHASDVPVVWLAVSEDGLRACAPAAVGGVPSPPSADAVRAVLRGLGVLRAVKRRPPTVLVVADKDATARLAEALGHDGVGVHHATSEDVATAAGELSPDLVIVDVCEADPFGIAQRMAHHTVARGAPLAFALPDHTAAETWLRLAAQARHAAANGELIRDELLGAGHRLERALPHRAGLVDLATRLYTSRYLRHCLAEEVDRAWRLHRPFSVVLFEPDAGARASLGGASGAERLLREVADVLRRHTRSANPICRYGPSTFAVLLAETSKDGARFVADKLRRLVAETSFATRGMEPTSSGHERVGRLTVSGGVATFLADGETADHVLASADRALKRAQQNGGNRVEGAEQVDREPKQPTVADRASEPGGV